MGGAPSDPEQICGWRILQPETFSVETCCSRFSMPTLDASSSSATCRCSFELGSVGTLPELGKVSTQAGIKSRSIASDVATYEAQIYLQTWTASFRSVPVCTQAKPNLLGQCRLTRNVENQSCQRFAEEKVQQPFSLWTGGQLFEEPGAHQQ